MSLESMKILVLANHQVGLYKFRRELLEALLKEGYEVCVSVPDGPYSRELRDIGVELFLNPYMDRRGTNPFHDMQLLRYYRRLLKRVNPDVVLTYTIKPNVYGGYSCGRLGIPYIANITGLGTSIQTKGLLQRVSLALYRIGLKKASVSFFQNCSNRDFMLEQRVVSKGHTKVLPGSGVNTAQHCYADYPSDDHKVVLSSIGRMMKEKGTSELLDAAEIVKRRHPEVIFQLVGDYDGDYRERVEDLQDRGVITYLGFQKDVHPIMSGSHAILHASHHEGLSNVLLEAASTGRPVIATNVPGCIETFTPGETGIAFKPKDVASLVGAVEQFLSLPLCAKEDMGKAGREKVVQEFDRQIVIDEYLKEIKQIEAKQA